MPITKEAIKARAKKFRSRIKFRSAIDLDIMQLVNIAVEYADEAIQWKEITLDVDKLVQCIIFSMKDKDQRIFIATKKGKIIGVIWAALTGFVWSSNCICQDLFLYVDKKHRGFSVAVGLVKMMEAWAKACGAKIIHTGTNSGIFKDRPASALYEGLEYEAGGFNFYKVL